MIVIVIVTETVTVIVAVVVIAIVIMIVTAAVIEDVTERSVEFNTYMANGIADILAKLGAIRRPPSVIKRPKLLMVTIVFLSTFSCG